VVSGTTFASCGQVPNTATLSSSNDGPPVQAKASTAVTCVAAQIAPTNTTCQQFATGASTALTQVTYQTAGTANIKNAQPGVFFYFVKVTAPSSSFTVDIPQTIQSGTGPIFGIFSTSAFVFANGTCTTFSSVTISGGGTDNVIMFKNATAGAVYVVAVKYSGKSIVGQPKPNPDNITYQFAANLNGVLVPGSPQTLQLVKTG
jgi:hypothetical protein